MSNQDELRVEFNNVEQLSEDAEVQLPANERITIVSDFRGEGVSIRRTIERLNGKTVNESYKLQVDPSDPKSDAVAQIITVSMTGRQFEKLRSLVRGIKSGPEMNDVGAASDELTSTT